MTDFLPRGSAVRRDAGLWGYERSLQRHGFAFIAGADEAGRGASAGPLVAAAVVLGCEIKGLADSKVLSPAVRDSLYAKIIRRAQAHAVVIVSVAEVDAYGLHRCNVAALRRAVSMLPMRPSYVLTDGFPVPGLPAPSLAVWKGDRVSATVAAASILAKVTRDRILAELDAEFPEYGFAEHKGYNTPEHLAALDQHGPCRHHRRSFVTISSRLGDDDAVTTALAAGGAQ